METKITKKAILKAIDNYIHDHLDNKSRQARLQKMVDNHGVELTSLACGFSGTTLVQYLRLKSVGGINENSVIRGERIFKELSTK